MADRNFNQENQSYQSNQDWERDRKRSNQENERSTGSSGNSGYGAQQNRGLNQGYGDVGYSGDSAHGMNEENRGNYKRANYFPDNDENRGYGNRDYENTQYGTSGTSGYRASGMDYNPGGYRGQEQANYRNSGNYYGQQNWNRERNDDNDSDWNQRQMHQRRGGSWSSDYGWQDRERSNVNYDRYGNRGYGNIGNEYNQDWNRNRGSDYNRDWDNDRYRGNVNRDRDENWWERTKDKVGSWFSDDDKDERRNREYGGHRGKGPTDYRRSQDRIREDICDRLTDDDRVDASNIRVQIENDVVILSGTVHSRDEKRRAEDLVESVSGVHDVENRLRVGKGAESRFASHDYTGNTDRPGGIGTESGTTNEIIRNVANDRKEDKKL
ncbi:MAG TPA: BON domain-containing protein [Flavisolibacter sp.]|nr:BON domain-containing protein [Flavisolibacter sp.]